MNPTETLRIEKEYITSDLCLAVILKMNGAKIKRVDPIDQKRFKFCFEENESLMPIVRDYFQLPLSEHPYKKFFNEMREIKNIIYNYRSLS